VGMADPSNLAGNPSWPLRNLLLMAAHRWGVTQLTVACWRSRGGRFCPERSLWLQIALPQLPEGPVLYLHYLGIVKISGPALGLHWLGETLRVCTLGTGGGGSLWL